MSEETREFYLSDVLANIVNHYTIRCADHDVDGPGIVHTGEDVCFWARGPGIVHTGEDVCFWARCPGWTNHPVDLGEVEMNFFLNKHGHCALDISRRARKALNIDNPPSRVLDDPIEVTAKEKPEFSGYLIVANQKTGDNRIFPDINHVFEELDMGGYLIAWLTNSTFLGKELKDGFRIVFYFMTPTKKDSNG